jgi:hypothetical protein
MRRILSRQEIERKERRNRTVGGVVLIFLLVVSTIGFAITGLGGGSNKENNELKEGSGFYNGNGWIYLVGGQEYFFNNNKESVLGVSLNIQKNLGDFAGKQVYVYSENPAVSNQLFTILGRFASRIQEACYGSCEKDLPEKTCQDNLIVFVEKEEEGIYQEDNCVFIEGSLKTAEAFLFSMLGI